MKAHSFLLLASFSLWRSLLQSELLCHPSSKEQNEHDDASDTVILVSKTLLCRLTSAKAALLTLLLRSLQLQ